MCVRVCVPGVPRDRVNHQRHYASHSDRLKGKNDVSAQHIDEINNSNR